MLCSGCGDSRGSAQAREEGAIVRMATIILLVNCYHSTLLSWCRFTRPAPVSSLSTAPDLFIEKPEIAEPFL